MNCPRCGKPVESQGAHDALGLCEARLITDPNHNEAWSLAHTKVDTSNLARCYIELRKTAYEIVKVGGGAVWASEKVREICKSND